MKMKQIAVAAASFGAPRLYALGEDGTVYEFSSYSSPAFDYWAPLTEATHDDIFPGEEKRNSQESEKGTDSPTRHPELPRPPAGV